jgi:hypothetical protein
MIIVGAPIAEQLFTLLEHSMSQSIITGNTSWNNLKSDSITGGVLSTSGVIIFEASGGCTGNLGAKNFKSHWNGYDIFQFQCPASPSNVAWYLKCVGQNMGVLNSQRWACQAGYQISGGASGGPFVGTYIATPKDTAVNQQFYMYGQLLNAGDTMWCDKFHIRLIPEPPTS